MWPFYMLDVLNRFLHAKPDDHKGNPLARAVTMQEACKIAHEARAGLESVVGPGPLQGRVASSSSTECQQGKNFALREFADRLSSITISSAFSGIDTPATASLHLLWAANCELGRDVEDVLHRAPRNLYAIEVASKSCDELIAHPHPPMCVFADIEEFWEPAVKTRVDSLIQSGLVQDVLVPLVLSGKAAKREAWCCVHGKTCQAGRFGVSNKLDLFWNSSFRDFIYCILFNC